MHTGDSDANRRPRVLVVEDEVLVRMMIAEELRVSGFDVAEAASADEALRLARSGELFDAVFSDVRMPGAMDGADLAAQLRSELPGLVVVLTSAHLGGATLSDPSRFIAKPYMPRDVADMLTGLLQARGADDATDSVAC